MRKKTLMAALLAVIILSSCASLYIKPAIQATLYKQQVPGNAAVIFKAALYILPALGYKIEGSSQKDGSITTSPVEITVDPSTCDCGSSLGLPVIKSKGTKAKVYFIIGVSNNELTVKAEIEPVMDDLMSAIGAAANIVCVSKGKLEDTLAKNFIGKMKTNVLQMLFK